MEQSAQNRNRWRHGWLAVFVLATLVTDVTVRAQATGVSTARRSADAREDGSPWGIASGAEWSGDFPRFNPMLREAGVRWLRYFPEWQTIQPRQGEWKWESADRLVSDSNANGIRITGVFAYFAQWASADGGTRRCPVKDMQYWREYVRETVTRYRKSIQYWEVWNEFNGSFAVDGTPTIYADMVREAYVAAKQVDPGIAIGISCANFDVGWLDAVIKAGAADHFDYVCVHPYENLGAVMQGGESGFLSLAGSLRRMLAANKQRADLPLWITEIGSQAPIGPDSAGDARQAEALVKAYILSIAQGFQRLFWFEARGPTYGKGTDHGIIRQDWSTRPAFKALTTMTGLLGRAPRYLGWLKLDASGYGFVFQAPETNVLVAWAPPEAASKIKFSTAVRVIDLAGATKTLEAGRVLALTRTPVFIVDLPASDVARARRQAKQPFPWGFDHSQARIVSCRLGAVNDERGIKQTKQSTTAVVNGLTESWRRTDFSSGGEGRYVYFRVDPTFASFGTRNLEITVVARRLSSEKNAGMNMCYESLSGYQGAAGWWTIPAGADDAWHEFTWKVTDANFVGGWGWNFRIDTVGSPNEVLIKEVRVTKRSKTQE